MRRVVAVLILLSCPAILAGCVAGPAGGGPRYASLWSTRGQRVARDVAAISAGIAAARKGSDDASADRVRPP